MLKEAIGHGDTVEEALEDAKIQLGVSDDEDIQFDVLTVPKKKVMGLFGGSKAEVKVSVERDEKPAKKEKPLKNKEGKKQENKKEKPAKEKAKKPVKAAQTPEESENLCDASELQKDSRALKAVDYLKSILKELGCEDTVFKVAERENGALIVLDGEDLGVIIGRRGETLDALQHLASLAARDNNGYFKVTLNIGNYREKREDTLSALATRVAESVLKSGKGKALEPMNPYERRIIHTAIQGMSGVTSASVGEGAKRRVVVVLEGHDVNEVRVDYRGGRKNDRHSHRRGDRRPQKTVTAPTREPRSDSSAFPLYGKIEPKK